MPKKYIIAYVCHVSNQHIHSKVPLRLRIQDRILLSIKSKKISDTVEEFAVWNSYAIEEMQKVGSDFEFHIISPYPYLRDRTFEYNEDGIYYHFFRNDDSLLEFLQRNIYGKLPISYRRERKRIAELIEKIKPDILHYVGAENPYYSISALDAPHDIPLVVQLQTLMSEPEFQENAGYSVSFFKSRCKIEEEVLSRADYIGTNVVAFQKIITRSIKPDARFVNMPLMLSEPVDRSDFEKKFDFVYFAANINKSCDHAVEAFILASKKHPGITLDIVGGYTAEFRSELDARLKDAGIIENVTYEGKLPSHSDVIQQIRCSRYAILPLIVDQVSCTIRESLANGLPVVTTITPATPRINENRECILLSPKGDFSSLANNMCRLIEDRALAETLRNNAFEYMRERSSNEAIMYEWIGSYKNILANVDE